MRKFLLNSVNDRSVIYFEVDDKGCVDVFIPMEILEDGKSKMLKVMTLGRKAAKDYLTLMTGLATKAEKERIQKELRKVVASVDNYFPADALHQGVYTGEKLFEMYARPGIDYPDLSE